MQEEKNRRFFNKKLLVSILIFIVAYFLFLFLWLKIEYYYGKSIINIASYSTALIKKNVDFEKINVKNDGQLGAQFLIKHKKGLRVIINFDFSTFTFNAPLSFAIMASLFLFIKNRGRAYIETLLILFTVHFLDVFTSETGRLSYLMANNHIEETSELQLFAWQYVWGFIDGMVVRFEPFLVGFYIYLRFSSSEIKAERIKA